MEDNKDKKVKIDKEALEIEKKKREVSVKSGKIIKK